MFEAIQSNISQLKVLNFFFVNYAKLKTDRVSSSKNKEQLMQSKHCDEHKHKKYEINRQKYCVVSKVYLVNKEKIYLVFL